VDDPVINDTQTTSTPTPTTTVPQAPDVGPPIAVVEVPTPVKQVRKEPQEYPEEPVPKKVRFDNETEIEPEVSHDAGVVSDAVSEVSDSVDKRAPPATFEGFVDLLYASRDKMMFIWHRLEGTVTKKWYLVQTQLDGDTSSVEIKQFGMVTVRFFVRHVTNSRKLTIEQCRYWPEIH
jgi:hypothetical protein